jgi:Putative auto-transporter adhesin, head GIN domain
LSGVGIQASEVKLDEVSLDLIGSTQLTVTCNTFELDTSGSAKVKAVLFGGELSIDVSGSAKIKTTGECKEDYKVSVSGVGSVIHKGTVLGRIKESKSGLATINIQQ